MKTKIILSIIFALFMCWHKGKSQNQKLEWNPKKALLVDGNQINDVSQETAKNRLRRLALDHSGVPQGSAEVEYARLRMSQIKNAMFTDLNKLREDINYYSDIIQKLNTTEDLVKLKELIRKKEENRKKLVENFNNNKLPNFIRKGIYVVLVKKDFDENKDFSRYETEIQEILASEAPIYFNGVYTSRKKVVKNQMDVEDIIESYYSGKVKVLKNFNSSADFLNQYYLYKAEISVQYLTEADQNKLLDWQRKMSPDVIINLLAERDFEQKLRSKGVTPNDIESVVDLYNREVNRVKSENRAIENQLRFELNNLKDQDEQIQREINNLNLEINNKGLNIEELCRTLNIKYNPNNPTESAKALKKRVGIELSRLTEQYIQIQEREIIYEELPEFSITGNLANDVSDKMLELYYSVSERYSSINSFENRSLIVNLNPDKVDNSASSEKFRKIKNAWFYKIYRGGNKVQVALFAQFSISDDKFKTPSQIKNDRLRKEEDDRLRKEKEDKKNKRLAFWKKLGDGAGSVIRGTADVTGKALSGLGDQISNSDGLSFNYQINQLYNHFDIGYLYYDDFDEGFIWGASGGWYFKDESRRGLLLKPQVGYLLYFFRPMIGGKIGLGKKSFLALSLKLGLRLPLGDYADVYIDFGSDFVTEDGAYFTIDLGFNLFEVF